MNKKTRETKRPSQNFDYFESCKVDNLQLIKGGGNDPGPGDDILEGTDSPDMPEMPI